MRCDRTDKSHRIRITKSLVTKTKNERDENKQRTDIVRKLFYIVCLLMTSQIRHDNNEKNVDGILVQCTTTVKNRLIFFSL